MTELQTRLGEYYSLVGISPLNFKCSNYSNCCKNKDGFTEAKASFVPDEYSALPYKIVFLSLDSGSGEKNPEKRTLESVKMEYQGKDPNSYHKGKHWYQTHRLATEILNSLLEDHISIKDSSKYFAHVNSAKCCENNVGRSQASVELFKNCREHLAGELKILDPEIIVTQGLNAKISLQAISTKKVKMSEEVSLITIEDKPVIHLALAHPAAYGKYSKQRKSFKRILAEIFSSPLNSTKDIWRK
jgi:hypothetical protein